MIYTISNDKLSVSIDSFGAELRSVKSLDGTEYIWQRDERYWSDSSPVLFPYIARLYNKSYTYCGELYNMDIHGFAAKSEFTAEKIHDNSITMTLRESESTSYQYPFRFVLRVIYSLSDSTLRVCYKVKNTGDKLMPYGIGGHPGINVPYVSGTNFEDYYLDFNAPCSPVRIGFTEELFLSGDDRPFPLVDNSVLPLEHSLFDDDAIILGKTAKNVSLHCKNSKKSLSMSFDGFDYFGIWHMPKTDAPYVCLEPWTSLPSRQGIVEEFCDKDDLLKLKPGEEHEHMWFMSISEE